jgi:hypothetical protein
MMRLKKVYKSEISIALGSYDLINFITKYGICSQEDYYKNLLTLFW